MEEPIRIAQVIGKLKNGGVESVIYNYYRNIDHNKFQFDFYIDEDSDFEFPQRFIDMGAGCFIIPPYQKPFSYMSELIKDFKENKYDIVHVNMNTLSVFSLCAAWIAGVPVRINHNHSTAGKGEAKRNLMKYILKPFSKIFATDFMACSEHAGRWLFGNHFFDKGNVTVLNNAIDFEKFQFNSDERTKLRQELGIDDYFVIGHIGRFMQQKNHTFLVDIFNEVHKINPKTFLMLIGDGELRNEIMHKVESLGLSEYTMFVGATSDVAKYYQAMDILCFPSLYEGLGMVAIEEQACNLPVVASTEVPGDIKITPYVEFIPLDRSAEFWAKKIIESKLPNRSKTQVNLLNCSFDIKTECKKLENFYENCLSHKEMIYEIPRQIHS